MSHAYSTVNRLHGLAAAAFTWSPAYSSSDRAYLNDSRMDRRVNVGNGSGSPSTTTVVIDLGTARGLKGFALLNHNFAIQTGGTGTVKVEGADDSGMSTNLVTAKAATTLSAEMSANAMDPKNKDHVLQFAAVTKRYWRLTFAWSGGSITNLTFGELYAYDDVTQLTRKGIYGSGDREDVFTSEIQFGNGDTRGLFLGGPVRSMTLRWQDLSESELLELRALWYAAYGNAGKLLFIPSYEATATAAAAAQQDCIYGRLSRRNSIEYPEMDYLLHSFDDLVVRSLGREVGA